MSEPVEDIADAVRQLVEPALHVEVYEWQDPERPSHRATRRHLTKHPSLLAQLEDAGTAGQGDDSAMTGGYESRPAARLEAVDALVQLDRRAAAWIRRLGHDDDRALPDTLRQLVGLSTALTDPSLTALHHDVLSWVTWARVITGWDRPPNRPAAPCPLCETYGSLRLRLDQATAVCTACWEAWDPHTIGVLADHVRSWQPTPAQPDPPAEDRHGVLEELHRDCLAAAVECHRAGRFSAYEGLLDFARHIASKAAPDAREEDAA